MLVIATVFGVIGTLAGVAGVLVAAGANRLVKRGNQLAEDANRVAGEASAAAAEANKIADSANQLSQEANTISRRALTSQTEQHFVDWEPRWEEDEAVLVLTNRGGDDAHRPTVVIASENLHRVHEGPDVVPPGEQIRLDLPGIIDQRAKHEVEQAGIHASLRSSGMIYFSSPFQITLKITVVWTSEAGFAKTQSLELEVS